MNKEHIYLGTVTAFIIIVLGFGYFTRSSSPLDKLQGDWVAVTYTDEVGTFECPPPDLKLTIKGDEVLGTLGDGELQPGKLEWLGENTFKFDNSRHVSNVIIKMLDGQMVWSDEDPEIKETVTFERIKQ